MTALANGTGNPAKINRQLDVTQGRKSGTVLFSAAKFARCHVIFTTNWPIDGDILVAVLILNLIKYNV